MELSPIAFVELRRLVRDLTGIVLGDEKAYLIQHRLEAVAQFAKARSFEELAYFLRLDRPGLRERLIDAIITPETSFFRDSHPFDALRTVLLPQMADEAQRRQNRGGFGGIRIWCAATATGQEPYSVAMILVDWLRTARPAGLSESNIRILATDISQRMLETAQDGIYLPHEVERGLNAGHLARHFVKHGDSWQVGLHLRKLIDFRRINLLQLPTMLGPFDLILCRNVLIYFDESQRRKTVDQMFDLLQPGGRLLLGSAETLYGLSNRFDHQRIGEATFYRRPERVVSS